ncbi:MAG: DUF262 domain-containing protein [Thiomargarita sp.]|nr:DUF262 domain-containing protein [Thiomargarita sp.]
MSLDEEIKVARQQIVKDGYDMSVGELMSLYRDQELIINPAFQRYFRWDEGQKTKFIESLLLGIPIPPIFVFQTDEGTWELVDGLQRLSTLFELAGILINSKGKREPPSILQGTNKLPSLHDKSWENGLTKAQQFDIKRARIRVEILGKGTNPYTKFELFQRLNESGSILTEQEIRTCTMVMVNKVFHQWIVKLSKSEPFLSMIAQTEKAQNKQMPIELTLRFFIHRKIPYQSGLNTHDYLDDGMLRLASDEKLDFDLEEKIFFQTFSFLNETVGKNVFKRWYKDEKKFKGQFLVSAYQIIAGGVSKHLETIAQIEKPSEWMQEKIERIWKNNNYFKHLTGGTHGAMQLAKLLPDDFFRP